MASRYRRVVSWWRKCGCNGCRAVTYQITKPPLTLSDCPVIQCAAGEHKKRTTSATSSAFPRRPNGLRSIARRKTSGSEKYLEVMSLSTYPGATDLPRRQLQRPAFCERINRSFRRAVQAAPSSDSDSAGHRRNVNDVCAILEIGQGSLSNPEQSFQVRIEHLVQLLD